MKRVLKNGLLLFAAFALLLSISACGSSSSMSSPSTPSVTATKNDTNQNTTASDINTENNNSIESLLKDVNLSEKNAVLSAIKYLDFSAFSKNGLIHQLSSEYGDKYPIEDATFAVDFLEENGLVDWGEQAIKSAKDYLDYSAFSRVGLIKQLTSEYGEQFSEDEATFAVNYLEENGLVDWGEQAIKSAKDYLDYSSFSRSELIEQLTSSYGEGFTMEEAEYAVSQLGY